MYETDMGRPEILSNMSAAECAFAHAVELFILSPVLDEHKWYKRCDESLTTQEKISIHKTLYKYWDLNDPFEVSYFHMMKDCLYLFYALEVDETEYATRPYHRTQAISMIVAKLFIGLCDSICNLTSRGDQWLMHETVENHKFAIIDQMEHYYRGQQPGQTVPHPYLHVDEESKIQFWENKLDLILSDYQHVLGQYTFKISIRRTVGRKSLESKKIRKQREHERTRAIRQSDISLVELPRTKTIF
jgi:hypothetical protein